jgi:tRNA U34 5-methylaminomethyl-2-thiouridine-forming methyltransferase MnmC
MLPRLPEFHEVVLTKDGSYTLRSPLHQQTYHSHHGAIEESLHVFVASGLLAVTSAAINVLEVGLGTGLNMLLTWREAERGAKRVHYTALEPFPLNEQLLVSLGHTAQIGWTQEETAFFAMMREPANTWHYPSPMFAFQWQRTTLGQWDRAGIFDLVYYDAFSPRVQPELWTEEAFGHAYRAIRPGGSLVTYCAKGSVRRAMAAAGFTVERLPGPPGKRHMLRAQRPT